MFYAFGSLVVTIILFALCKTQDQTLDAERDFWIKFHELDIHMWDDRLSDTNR
jgi:hypothetical protein